MFEVLCTEKKEAIWRTVSFMPRTVPRMLEVVELMSKVANFLPSTNPFVMLVDPDNLFFQVDNVGLIAVFPHTERSLHAHITFWDGRLRGRERLCRNLAEFVCGVSRKFLITAIPEKNRAVLAFARRAGFEEGYRNNGIVVLNFTNYTG
jgi:hypothetical protein